MAEPRRHWALRVRAWILALALVPLSGAAWFALTEVENMSDSRSSVETVEHSTEKLVRLAELEAGLLQERTWRSAVIGIQDLGLSDELVTELIGVDLAEETSMAAAAVDEALAGLDWPVFVGVLADIREPVSGSPVLVADDFEAAANLVRSRSAQTLDQLMTEAGDIDAGAQLVSSLRVLDAATGAQRSVTLQMTTYLPSRLQQFSEATMMRDLAAVDVSYSELMATIERVAEPDSMAAALLPDIEDSTDVRQFRQIISSALAGGADKFAASVLDLSTPFLTGAETTGLHALLVAAAADDVEAASADVRAAANRSARNTVISIAVVTVLSLLFALGLAAAIGRPLQRLAVGAQRLRDGEGADLAPSGPREIRDAMLAINEAGGHIDLAQRQAQALALGNLEDPVLAERGPGLLGASLHDAVLTLTTSLAESEEFQYRLAHEATHDALTGLGNRAATLTHLKYSLNRNSRTSDSLAVLFLDLDGFKGVNDRYGHFTGDHVLRAVSDRLGLAVRLGDYVGRLGGDEFLVVAESVDGADAAVALADRISRTVSLPVEVGQNSIPIGVSVGIALAFARSHATAEELLRDADLALYRAKAHGGGRAQLCDDALHDEVIERAQIESEIRRALADDEFELHYQPIIDATTGHVDSVEALIRWPRPDGGWICPDEFIPIAERSDLILDIDRWVIGAAARQLHAWTTHPQLANTPIAVNVSGRHVSLLEFGLETVQPLYEFGVDPSLLMIEVTESALLDDLEIASNQLGLLRDLGVRIAVDDFGTGFTSLQQLRRLPVDILKIDRSFVADPKSESLVKLIVEAGHLLDIEITVEGIETSERAQRMVSLGADHLQGFLFARPVAAEMLRLGELRFRGEGGADQPDATSLLGGTDEPVTSTLA